MRAIPLFLLLSVGTPVCGRVNPDYCDDDNRCESDKFCNHLSKAAPRPGRCEMPRCNDSSTCKADAPVCDAEVRDCRACTAHAECARFPGAAAGGGSFCVAGRCRECDPGAGGALENSGCATLYGDRSRPVCEAQGDGAGTCRGCELHGECDSQICVKDDSLRSLPGQNALARGACAGRDRVLVVSESANACSPGPEPQCRTLDTALPLAGEARPFIRLVSVPPAMNQSDRVSIDGASLIGVNLHIVGPSADQSPALLTTAPKVMLQGQSQGMAVGSSSAVYVTGKASVTLEGVLLGGRPLLSRFGLRCNQQSQVTLLRAVVTGNAAPVGVGSAGVSIEDGCAVAIDQSWIGRFQPVLGGAEGGGNRQAINVAAGGKLTMTNSVVLGNGGAEFGGVRLEMAAAAAADALIINSTLVASATPPMTLGEARLITCDSGTKLRLFNTYLFGFIGADAQGRNVAANCQQGATNTGFLATDEQNPMGTKVISALPADLANLDGSPQALPDLTLVGAAKERVGRAGIGAFGADKRPDRDMVGKPRPKDNPAIGAFEP